MVPEKASTGEIIKRNILGNHRNFMAGQKIVDDRFENEKKKKYLME
jgi:hypothetical protein